jgi:hypothetical protein
MPEIINNLNQRIIVNLVGGKSIDLSAKGKEKVSAEELTSPHLRILMEKGDISPSVSEKKKGGGGGQKKKTKPDGE